MNRTFAIALVATVVFAWSPAIADTQTRSVLGVGVTVSMQLSANRHLLHVRLTNNASTPFTMFDAALPWKWRYAMIIVPVQTDLYGTIIQDENQPIDDPVPELITISPGETIEGTIDLDDRIAKLSDTLRTADVLLLWSYDVRPARTISHERVSGVILINRLVNRSR